MPKIVPIVEGFGESEGLPGLLIRILHAQECWDIYPDKPLNAKGVGNLTAPDGIERFVQSAVLRPDCGAVLVLVDADKQCAVDRSRGFTRRIHAIGSPRPVVIVAAVRMFENWILASAETIQGQQLDDGTRLPETLELVNDVEGCGGKATVKTWFPPNRPYDEARDQPALTPFINVALVMERSRSFRRLWHAVEEAVEAIRAGNRNLITPGTDTP
jgi:hypothetical protein